MLENMTTGEKALIGATALGIAALVFHKPTRNAVGLSDGKRRNKIFRVARDTGRLYTPILVEANSKREALLIAKKLNRKEDQKYIKTYRTEPSYQKDKYSNPRPTYKVFSADDSRMKSEVRIKQRGGKYKPSMWDLKREREIELVRTGKI